MNPKGCAEILAALDAKPGLPNLTLAPVPEEGQNIQRFTITAEVEGNEPVTQALADAGLMERRGERVMKSTEGSPVLRWCNTVRHKDGRAIIEYEDLKTEAPTTKTDK